MDARYRRVVFGLLCVLLLAGADYPTPNFVIRCGDPQLAKEMGDAAERYRKELAQLWLGKTLPDWSRPCPVTVHVGPTLGAGGATTFVFHRGEVYGWEMTIQGSRERLLDSVLPHEITHMILASHFRQPLPRWADEGAATTVEHITEREKHRRMLLDFLRTQRGIPFRRMFAMEEYPRDIMPLYAQGYTLAEFLIQQGGHQRFVSFLGDGLKDNQWEAALAKWYNYQDLSQLQTTWVAWVAQGYPQATPEATPPALVAVNTPTLADSASSNGDQWRTKDQATPAADSIYANAGRQLSQPLASTTPERGPRDSAVVPVSYVGDAASSASLSASAAGQANSAVGQANSAVGQANLDVGGWRPATPFSLGVPIVDLAPADAARTMPADAPTVPRTCGQTAGITAPDGQLSQAAYPPLRPQPDRVILDWNRDSAWR